MNHIITSRIVWKIVQRSDKGAITRSKTQLSPVRPISKLRLFSNHFSRFNASTCNSIEQSSMKQISYRHYTTKEESSESKKRSKLERLVSTPEGGYREPSAEELKSLLAASGTFYHDYMLFLDESFVIQHEISFSSVFCQ
jgi:hypothetical protein